MQNNNERVLSARELELCAMLRYRRPAWHKTELAFIQRFIAPTGAKPDSYGNYWLTIGESPSVLWSSHTDTVHRTGGMQKVFIDRASGEVFTDGADCLGADCTTGVWIMLQMARAGIPGLYIWHRAEEIGGCGSSFIAKSLHARLAGITHAIAFDRKGKDSIITYQGGRCASDAFAADLAGRLNAQHPGFAFAADEGGIFTDTANYTDIIGECSNLSVGYAAQHTKAETQDLAFACSLADAMCRVDLRGLVADRKPGEDEYTGFGRFGAGYAEPSYIAPPSFEDYVTENPGLVADYLYECGFNLSDLQSYEKTRRIATYGTPGATSAKPAATAPADPGLSARHEAERRAIEEALDRECAAVAPGKVHVN